MPCVCHALRQVGQSAQNDNNVSGDLKSRSAHGGGARFVRNARIWIFGSKLILSNNHSSATLWVPDTCFFLHLHLLVFFSTSLQDNWWN